MIKLFKKKPKKLSANELETLRLYETLAKTDPTTPEYAKILTYIGRLTEYGNDTRPDKVKKDTWVSAGANILSVGLVVGGESLGSKLLSKNALGLIGKPKI